MKNIPVSVWISAVILFIFSFNAAISNPLVFFHAFCFISVVVAFGRVIYWFIEEYHD